MEDSWIGLLHKVTNIAAKNEWVDNTPFDYLNFGQHEPNHEEKGDFCGQKAYGRRWPSRVAIITNGDELSKWKVVKCSETAYAYVCEKTRNGNKAHTTTSKKGFPHEFNGNKYAKTIAVAN
ncbi:hypothetical protein ANCDUO_00423 [Ancylostoma duodenale]|uniref:C-type lectin domain-containing protein n=1 Tax=Ancylostoma duodenale TaxID=51022 RepID=A0A0C2DH14_9BILA|nr:hypothetical protein ANCDUO_00423 [Ancylostoma duodenale]